jgi:hypothetical protein
VPAPPGVRSRGDDHRRRLDVRAKRLPSREPRRTAPQAHAAGARFRASTRHVASGATGADRARAETLVSASSNSRSAGVRRRAWSGTARWQLELTCAGLVPLNRLVVDALRRLRAGLGHCGSTRASMTRRAKDSLASDGLDGAGRGAHWQAPEPARACQPAGRGGARWRGEVAAANGIVATYEGESTASRSAR